MGTLYIVGVPAIDPQDMTLRAARILAQVRAVAGADPAEARRVLARIGLETQAVITLAEVPAALAAGDVAVLHGETWPAPPEPVRTTIEAVVRDGWPAVPIPGPSLPLTALVLSGLPADSALFAGPPGRLESVVPAWSGSPRTLVALEGPDGLARALARLLAAAGDRPVALAGPFLGWPHAVWRGRLSTAPDHLAAHPAQGECVLVVGGREEAPPAWDEDRLAAEIEHRLARGERAREIAQQLAAESGWPRRDIYRRATRRM